VLRGLDRLRRLRRRLPSFDDPAAYWEARADDLTYTFDHPETWERRGWVRGGVEDELVPRLLRECGAQTVLVIGAGSGRQYAYLQDFDVSGIDISPTLVATCRARYPDITTTVGDITAMTTEPVDAVVSSAVLQHVRPRDIDDAVDNLKTAAQRVIVIRESTHLAAASDYQFAHDYRSLLKPWVPFYEETTDELDSVTVELIAFRPG
jgi:SAM-dependent methyltransferase